MSDIVDFKDVSTAGLSNMSVTPTEQSATIVNLLGTKIKGSARVDLSTSSWQNVGFTEGQTVKAGDFIAQNVSEAGWGDRVFRPYTLREVGGVRVGVIGQAFPYTPIAHPRRFVPDLTFGIREDQIQALIDELRDQRKV